MSDVSTTAFPKHDVNPKLKLQPEWALQAAKAVWHTYNSQNHRIFYKHAQVYKIIDEYVMGQQSMGKMDKVNNVEESSDTSWVNIDKRPIMVAAKLRDIAISKIYQRQYNVVCTPIDPLAKDETDKYYADAKTKILMRDNLMKVNPQLVNSPAIAKVGKEADDLEELEMMMNFGVPLKVAMEAEMGIEYVFEQNSFKTKRKKTIEKLWDYGVGIYKDDVDADGNVIAKWVDPAAFGTSWCIESDFSDAWYWFYMADVSVNTLPFSPEQLVEIAAVAASSKQQIQNANKNNVKTDREKCKVMDLQLITYNDQVWEKRVDKVGNVIHRRQNPDKYRADEMITVNGKEEAKYKKATIQTLWECKWVFGTNYVYDVKWSNYQKRDKKNKAKVYPNYHIKAYNFNNMRAVSMQERLMPLIDQYHSILFKIQNFQNNWIPYILELDLDALESVAFGAGGEKMTPKQILELVYQKFVAIGRKKDISGVNQNYKMVDIRTTGMHQEYEVLVGDLARILNEMRDVTGLNELTDGSTPGERTLNYVASLGNDATNNAIYPVIYADKCLTESLARGVIQRLVLTVQNGNIEGVARALGSETVRFIQVTKDICDRMWDVAIEDRPTDQERQMLLQQLNLKDAQGSLDPEDIVMIQNTRNLKQAQVQLAYKAKKKQKQKDDQALAQIQANGQQQQQSALVTAQAEQQNLVLASQLKRQEIELTSAWQLILDAQKIQGAAAQQESKGLHDIALQTIMASLQAQSAPPQQAAGQPAQ